MFKTAILAAFALACLLSPAQARQHHRHHHRHQHHVAAQPACDGFFCQRDNNPFSGARSITVTMHRVRHRTIPLPRPRPAEQLGYASPFQSFITSKPARYIAGRLICAVNVGSALAERGIKGTGSALALSYLHWGRSAGGPVPGAVIVSARHGGGHVAIVSRVVNNVVYAWNATGGQSGWREIPYRHVVLDYRVPG